MQVHFSVDGAWLTSMLRDQFWSEHRPLGTIYDIVRDMIVPGNASESTVHQIAESVLSFDKKFQSRKDGTLRLVADGSKPHQNITLQLQKNQRNDLVNQITKDIEKHPLMYIDYWSAEKTIVPLIKYAKDHKLKLTADAVSYWLMRNTGLDFAACFKSSREPEHDLLDWSTSEDKPFENGCWLLHAPQTVADYADQPLSQLSPDLRQSFWDGLADDYTPPDEIPYVNWQERISAYREWQIASAKEKKPFTDLFNERTAPAIKAYEYCLPGAHTAIKAGKVLDQEVMLRNSTKDPDAVANLLLKTKKDAKSKAAAQLAKQSFDHKVQEILQATATSEPTKAEPKPAGQTLTCIGTSYEPGLSDDEFERRVLAEHRADAITKPSTDLDTWECLISPDGAYYPCGFGIHTGASYNLIRQHPSWFIIFNRQNTIVASDRETVFADSSIFDVALDVVLANGWIAIRQMPGMGDYISTGNSVPGNPVAKMRHIQSYMMSQEQQRTLHRLCEEFDTDPDTLSER